MIRFPLSLPKPLQSAKIGNYGTLQILKMLLQIAERAYRRGDKPQNDLAQTLAFIGLVGHQGFVGIVTQVGWLTHVYDEYTKTTGRFKGWP
jgi:hypothetical protein